MTQNRRRKINNNGPFFSQDSRSVPTIGHCDVSSGTSSFFFSCHEENIFRERSRAPKLRNIEGKKKGGAPLSEDASESEEVVCMVYCTFFDRFFLRLAGRGRVKPTIQGGSRSFLESYNVRELNNLTRTNMAFEDVFVRASESTATNVFLPSICAVIDSPRNKMRAACED